jgi:hypothetical protein
MCHPLYLPQQESLKKELIYINTTFGCIRRGLVYYKACAADIYIVHPADRPDCRRIESIIMECFDHIHVAIAAILRL